MSKALEALERIKNNDYATDFADELMGIDIETVKQALNWQPIETAPKDGREIIVFGRGCATQVKWNPEQWGGCWQVYDDETLFQNPFFTLSHWMPLPEKEE